MAWLCLWTDILDCPKLAELDDETIGGWVLILAATKRHDKNGIVPEVKRLSHWCRRPEMKIRAWISKLEDVGLLDENDGEISVHDWLDWQPRLPGRPITGHAKTHAQRQREYRDRIRVTRDGVTSRDTPLHPPEENTREEERILHITSRDENIKVTNKVTRDAIIVTPDTPHLCTSFNIQCEQCRRDECIKQAGEKWGASNGEAVINDLLRTYVPEIVMEAMDACWNKFQNELKPAYLRKCCEGKFRDHSIKNGKLQ